MSRDKLAESTSVIAPSTTTTADAEVRIQLTGRLDERRSFESYASPLPPADELARLKEIDPSIPSMLVAAVRSEVAHRQSMESQAMAADISAAKRGQWFGFILGISALGAGVWMIHEGQSGYGVAAILGAVATISGAKILGAIQRTRQQPGDDAPEQLELPLGR